MISVGPLSWFHLMEWMTIGLKLYWFVWLFYFKNRFIQEPGIWFRHLHGVLIELECIQWLKWILEPTVLSLSQAICSLMLSLPPHRPLSALSLLFPAHWGQLPHISVFPRAHSGHNSSQPSWCSNSSLKIPLPCLLGTNSWKREYDWLSSSYWPKAPTPGWETFKRLNLAFHSALALKDQRGLDQSPLSSWACQGLTL